MTARRWFALAALLAGLFAANVALRILHIKLGITFWRLGDVGEFLLVLGAAASFVSGVLTLDEAAAAAEPPRHRFPNQEET